MDKDKNYFENVSDTDEEMESRNEEMESVNEELRAVQNEFCDLIQETQINIDNIMDEANFNATNFNNGFFDLSIDSSDGFNLTISSANTSGSWDEDYPDSYISTDSNESEMMPSGLSEAEIGRMPHYNLQEDKNEKCQICLSDFKKEDSLRCLPCLHQFHSHCIDQWLFQSGSCPICRLPVEV